MPRPDSASITSSPGTGAGPRSAKSGHVELNIAASSIAASSEDGGFRDIPPRESWQLSQDAAYVHITANETIHGVEFRPAWGEPAPHLGDVPLLADFSSSIASEPIDISRYGLIDP